MRHLLPTILAAAMAASAFAVAEARTVQIPATALVTDAKTSIEEVRDRRDRHWKHRRHSDNRWRHHRHNRRHAAQFFFTPFPFFAPRQYSYAPGYGCNGRLFYGRDGRLHCAW